MQRLTCPVSRPYSGFQQQFRPLSNRVTSDASTTIAAANRIPLVPYHRFSLWNKYQFDENVGASVGLISFSDSFASSDDTVKLPEFFRVDAALYFKIKESLRAQLNVENLQQRLLGFGRRQQQHLARTAAHGARVAQRQVLRDAAITTISECPPYLARLPKADLLLFGQLRSSRHGRGRKRPTAISSPAGIRSATAAGRRPHPSPCAASCNNPRDISSRQGS
jgi:TonB dependent receptor